MNARVITLAGALALGLCGCPAPEAAPDGGFLDGGAPNTVFGPCTGGCAANQKCDPESHQCVDGCPGCTGVCVKNAAGAFACLPASSACGASTCSAGQPACSSGNCSCVTYEMAAKDSCAADGRVCNGPYNPGLAFGGACVEPKMYEACRTTECASGTCAACPSGGTCQKIFSDVMMCTRNCSNTAPCGSSELCSDVGCLPKTADIFGDPKGAGASFDCFVRGPAGFLADGGADPDAGLKNVTVPVSNTCIRTDGEGIPNEVVPGVPTGNCTYDFWRLADQTIAFSSCHAPGGATQGATCKRDTAAATSAVQCGTGLECALTRGDTGQCLKMCNAAPPQLGFAPEPSCSADEDCVNIYRRDDPIAVVGVCMKKCNVFSATGAVCADYGSTQASCVPVPANGLLPVSTDGAGVCVPQKAAVANAGEPCAEVDSFKGASCASGLVCRLQDGSDTPTCVQPCDLSCAAASPPAYCSSQPASTRCSGGKTCARVTSTSGAVLGFCK